MRTAARTILIAAGVVLVFAVARVIGHPSAAPGMGENPGSLRATSRGRESSAVSGPIGPRGHQQAVGPNVAEDDGPDAGYIAGRVLFADGRAVAGAEVKAIGTDAATATRGG